MDYSHNGLLATIRHMKKRNVRFAGVGRNLADAAAPVYLECREARVALIAATSSFHETWAAGQQRGDMIGRPGVNPLRHEEKYHVTQKPADFSERDCPGNSHRRSAGAGHQRGICGGNSGIL